MHDFETFDEALTWSGQHMTLTVAQVEARPLNAVTFFTVEGTPYVMFLCPKAAAEQWGFVASTKEPVNA